VAAYARKGVSVFVSRLTGPHFLRMIMTREESKKLKQEIIEKFNEIAVLLRDIEEEYEELDVYNEETKEWVYGPNPNWTPENKFLLTSKNVVESLASGEIDDALDYYTSSF
jgi:hypothetical protein